MGFLFRKKADPDAGRTAIARFLDEHGPTPGEDLANALGLSLEAFWDRINHPWFRITGKGWALTELGAVEGLAARDDGTAC